MKKQEENTAESLIRGANSTRENKGNRGNTRRALGRGLSSLLSVTSVEVNKNNDQVTHGNTVVKTEATPKPTQLRPTILDSEANGKNESLGDNAKESKVKSLGEGLNTAAKTAEKTVNQAVKRTSTNEGTLVHLSIDAVFPNDTQPRIHFSKDEIDSLTDSIRESGLLQPIIVRRRGGDIGPLANYEIVAGERRWRAAKLAGLSSIPAVLRSLTDRETLQLAILENVQRADLNPVEEAIAYQRLIDEHGASQAEVAKSVGKNRASIANCLRLLKLPEEVKQMLITGKLSAGHGRAVLSLEKEAEQLKLAREIVLRSMSVREAEQYCKAPWTSSKDLKSKDSPTKPKVSKPAYVEELESRLRRALGTKVKLSMRGKDNGEVTISFFSKAELEGIIDKLN